MRELRTKEAIITIHEDHVVKVYLPRWYDLNAQHERRPEVEWYRERPISMMPELLDATLESITLAYAGEPIADPDFKLQEQRALPFPGLPEWLVALRRALRRARVQHRDIHPGNILHHEGEFVLIDWTWATRDLRAEAPPGHRSDWRAIRMLSRDL